MDVHVDWFPKSRGEAGSVQVDPGPEPATVASLLRTLDVPPDNVLVVRGDTPIPLDAPLEAGERLRIVWTVSGG